MVGEIDHDAFGIHAEGSGDELGVHGVDKVDQAGGAQSLGRDAAGVQEVADTGELELGRSHFRRWCPLGNRPLEGSGKWEMRQTWSTGSN